MALESILLNDQVFRMVCIGLISLLLVTMVPRIFQFLKLFRKFQSFPGDPNYSLIFGNLHKLPAVAEDRISYGRTNMLTRHPKYARFWFGPFRPVLTFYHPDTVKLLLKSSTPKSRGFGAVYEHALPWIGEGLIAANGHAWARSRRLLTPAFHFDILRPYMDIYNKAADTLTEKMDELAEKGDKFDICPLMTLCTLEVILKCAMSYDIDIQRMGYHPYAQAAQELGEAWSFRARTLYLWPDFLFRLTKRGRNFFKNCDYVHKVAEEIIAKRKKSMEEEEGPSKGRHLDFLDILLTARDEDGNSMTTKEIRNEVDTFMFAGHDTTACSMPWILYVLIQHPEYMQKVQAEIDALLEDRESDHIQWADLPELPTLAICIKEALRLYPPVPFIQRVLHEPIEVEGKTIHAGCQVTVPIIHLHRNPEVWDRPDEFWPERFLPENMKDLQHFSYIPFSAGSRNCIGQNFALNEEKVLIARMLRRYDMELAKDGPPVARNPQVVLKTEHGMWLTLKRRQL
ncbi:cytochrome P450 4A24 [Aplysia californica]|uniref:Cytochrome P450 4A24 n=1 Tax=Aplysia californica TaxID=6500 RepID=A0ABM1VZ18_APLCA|nr:cytochrome P450 4A24 [Aplysia californica]XP_035827661.1 cytochrome P450 4A24 [Aplysia californica]XP_035827662.1 cytochrome P450 4A24 [Aplysia californica]